MAADVVLYTTRYCFYCVRAKQLLSRKGVTYREIDVGADEKERDRLCEMTGSRRVPQIFIDGKSIGGFYELASLEREGKLDSLLMGRS